jgi:hypothetical protein
MCLPDEGPKMIRARLYRYRFETARQRRETGQWWTRSLAGEYLPPVSMGADDGKAAGRLRSPRVG